ncbi:type II toxin-antitoxin system PemK/MazF family toxin, partial [Bacillus cereus]
MLDKKTQKTQKSAALTRWHSNKITLAHRWIDDEVTQKQRRMVQGAIHLCELGENVGSEQNKKRPVLIISNNNINKNN